MVKLISSFRRSRHYQRAKVRRNGNRGEAPRRSPMATKANTGDSRSSTFVKNSGNNGNPYFRFFPFEATRQRMNSGKGFSFNEGNLPAILLLDSCTVTRNPPADGTVGTALRWLSH
nr:hypothetical protein Itr_chr02CG13340 [Ipomoea trifida]